MSKFQTRELNADIERKQLSITLAVPVIKIRGFYKADGKVIVVNVAGTGPFTCNLFNVVGSGFARIVTVTDARTGNSSLTIQDFIFDFDIGALDVHLDNLFDGKLPVLANTVNEFLNSQYQVIINEIKPQIQLEVTRLVQRVMNEAFNKLPVEEFLNKVQQVPRQQRETIKQQGRSIFSNRGGRFFPHRVPVNARHTF